MTIEEIRKILSKRETELFNMGYGYKVRHPQSGKLIDLRDKDCLEAFIEGLNWPTGQDDK